MHTKWLLLAENGPKIVKYACLFCKFFKNLRGSKILVAKRFFKLQHLNVFKKELYETCAETWAERKGH